MSRSTWIFLGATALVAGGAAWVASSAPDGLERVQADLGVDGHATTLYQAPLPDYTVPGLRGPLSGSVAGLAGAAVVGGLAWAAGRVLTRRPA